MKNLKITLFLPLLLGMSFVVINPCLAQTTTNNVDELQWGGTKNQHLNRNLADEDPRAIVANIIRLLLSFFAIMAIIISIFGIIKMIGHRGDETKRKSGKKKLIIGIVTLIVVFLAFILTGFVFSACGCIEIP